MWLLLTFGAWLFVKYRRDFPAVKYVDLLWPGRWPQYRVSLGNFYISQSEPLLRRGYYSLALHKLRVGVGKASANPQGRTLLARVYPAYQRPDLAKDVLLARLSYLPDDPVYPQTTLAFLQEFQEDAQLLEITSRLLAAQKPLLAALQAALGPPRP